MEKLRQQLQNLNNRGNLPVLEAVDLVASIDEDQRWAVLRQEFEIGAEAALLKRPALFFLIDNTKAGGAHVLRAHLNPWYNAAFVEIPQHNQPGRFPTVLHALEIIVTVMQLAGKGVYPDISFMSPSEFNLAQQYIQGEENIFMPLILDPVKTNAVIFHRQAHRLDPKSLAESYYGVLAQMDLTSDLMRHTMLVIPNDPFQRLSEKEEVAVEIRDRDEAKRLFRLLNVGRIRPWDSQEQSKSYTLTLRGDILNPYE